MFKKALFLSIVTGSVTFSGLIFSASSEKSNSSDSELPQVYLSVFDKSSSTPVDLKTTEVSRTNQKTEVCWIAVGDFAAANNVIENFTTPAKVEFSGPNILSTPSKNYRAYMVTSQRPAINDGKAVSACWKFGLRDPRGKYTVQVQIGEQKYAPAEFRIVQ